MALYRCPTAISATEGASPLEGFCASLCPELPATRAASASALMSLLVRILFSLLFVTWRFPSQYPSALFQPVHVPTDPLDLVLLVCNLRPHETKPGSGSLFHFALLLFAFFVDFFGPPHFGRSICKACGGFGLARGW